MRRILLALTLALPLSGCIDADVTLDFKDETNAEVIADFSLGRQLFDMAGKSAEESCKDGTHSLTTEKFTCSTRKTMTIDALIAESKGKGSPPDGPNAALRETASIERLDDNRLRISLDFAELGGNRDEAQEMKEMAGMMRTALAGHSLVFRIRAPKVVETTGTLSADGKSAEYVVPLSAVLEETAPKAFVTTIELKSCRFRFFC